MTYRQPPATNKKDDKPQTKNAPVPKPELKLHDEIYLHVDLTQHLGV